MFKRTLIAAALITIAGTAVADDATDSLADKALTELQMDTVTAGGCGCPEAELLSWSWGQTGLPAAEGGSMDLAAVNILRSR